MSFPVKKNQWALFAVAAVSMFWLLVGQGCGSRSEERIVTEARLGEKLFFEKALSRDSTVSCASCHKPEFAFADTSAVSEGVFHRTGTRNTPGVMNLKDRNFYFWDGRAATLADQALGPMENFVEMDFPLSLTVRRLIHDPNYMRAFRTIYGKPPSRELVAKALAAYEETLETARSPFDLYMNGTDTSLMTASAKRGLNIFNNKGRCFDCHFGVDFTGGDKFKNIGLYNGKDLNDPGRFGVTKDPRDLGAFKTPGLRNVELTAPYMHNGMHRTLREVIDFYDQPDRFVPDAINRDTILSRPLGLSEDEKTDLENFLKSLTDERFRKK